MIKIGDITLSTPYLLAPLAGYTDIAFREMAREEGAGLTYTEMVSAKGLVYGNEKTADLLRLSPSETPSAVQIFGSEPDIMARAIQMINADIIDINMGCPVRKIVTNGEGSALMLNPDLAQRIVETCSRAAGSRPVSVKFRLGFDDKHINCVEFAKKMEEAGAKAITLHGRTREQFYSGQANRELIKQAADAVSIPLFANGDIVSQSDVAEFSDSKVAGYMIGRGAIGKPEIFSELRGIFRPVDKVEQIKRHISVLSKYLPSYVVVNDMKKHICYYMKGVQGIKEIKNAVYNAKTLSELIQIVSNR